MLTEYVFATGATSELRVKFYASKTGLSPQWFILLTVCSDADHLCFTSSIVVTRIRLPTLLFCFPVVLLPLWPSS